MMEWNAMTPSQWDWENLQIFNVKASEIPKKVQSVDWGTEGDGGIDNESVYSSGAGNFSGSGFGHGSSSKSSISASMDSSSKGGMKVSEFNFEKVGLSKDLSKKKELARMENTGTSSTLGASVCSGEPLIGLKLGKRTYFEDVTAEGPVKTSSFPVNPTLSATKSKRAKGSYQSTQTPRCQVEGCNLDLTSAKDYHRRHRICESHSKWPKVIIAGVERRFCQQCSRFHDLLEFDEKKRSCRRRLSDHNARRRKPQPEAIRINSAKLSSLYDRRQDMSFLLNSVPLVHAMPATNPTWESICGFKLTQIKGSLMKPTKAEGTYEQPHWPNNELSTPISTLHHDSDRLLPFKGTTTEVLNQDVGAPMVGSNMDATPDLWRALSLLSTDTWGSGHPESSSLDHLIHVNRTSFAQSVMHSLPQGPSLGSSDCWMAGQRPFGTREHSLALDNNDGGQFLGFQLFKEPYESGLFRSNEMN